MRYKKILLPIILTISPLLLLVLTSGETVSPVVKFANKEGTVIEDRENTQEGTPVEENGSIDPSQEPGYERDNSRDVYIAGGGIGAPEGRFNIPKEDVHTQSDEYSPDYEISKNRGGDRARIVPSPVYAKVTHNAKLYNTINGGIAGEIEEGQKVEILQDRTCAWYEVSFEDTVAWVKSDALYIPPDPPTETARLTNEELEQFLDSKDFNSDTPYFLWVDIHRQLVYAFEKVDGQWNLIRTMICSTGVNESPTTRGEFTISDRDDWMYSNRLGSGAKYWVRFNNTYLFHSVAFAEDGQTIIDDTLGERSSAGCVRLSLEDSKWIYDNMEEGTGVWVN